MERARAAVPPICFDRSECDRYAQTLCLGCALALVRAYNRQGAVIGHRNLRFFLPCAGSPRDSTHPTAWVGDVPG